VCARRGGGCGLIRPSRGVCVRRTSSSVSTSSVLPAVPGGLYAPCPPCPPISCNACRLGHVCLSACLCGMFLMFSLAI
jgi:hypothetical protein